MAKDMKISVGAANAALDALVDALDTTGQKCTIKIYAGSIPATVATALHSTTNPELADIHFANPAFGTAATNQVVANATSTSETSAVSGTASFFRAYKSAGAATTAGLIQGTCGTTSSFDMNMNTTSIATGATVTITSWTITMPLG